MQIAHVLHGFNVNADFGLLPHLAEIMVIPALFVSYVPAFYVQDHEVNMLMVWIDISRPVQVYDMRSEQSLSSRINSCLFSISANLTCAVLRWVYDISVISIAHANILKSEIIRDLYFYYTLHFYAQLFTVIRLISSKSI
ncbi:hypothetical protein BDQ12DRAFT_203518 [Crucibulum laeve]|uniref:Uncharacterized protein n=1 Tax=Crucibulum laeve TaxID=68775 RepID=A0A5C3MH53_9AGAR|nr:hypothetical protein BDQ12DRAFT_203518 [Crucibulum laeve]